MKCFIAIEEDLLMEIWLLDPELVVPFSRAIQKTPPVTSDRPMLIEPAETLKTRKLEASGSALQQAQGAYIKRFDSHRLTHPDPKQAKGG